LKKLDIEFADVNILEDYPTMAIELREIYGWPTSPQLYIDGKLIGGSDIALEMAQTGELQKLLGVTENNTTN
jgi:monothiol glutaredoxin